MKSSIPIPERPIKPVIKFDLQDVKSSDGTNCIAQVSVQTSCIGTLSVDGKNMATWFTLSQDLGHRIGVLIQKFYEHKL